MLKIRVLTTTMGMASKKGKISPSSAPPTRPWVVLAAVKQCGRALRFADAALKSDRENVVLTKVNKTYNTIDCREVKICNANDAPE